MQGYFFLTESYLKKKKRNAHCVRCWKKTMQDQWSKKKIVYCTNWSWLISNYKNFSDLCFNKTYLFSSLLQFLKVTFWLVFSSSPISVSLGGVVVGGDEWSVCPTHSLWSVCLNERKNGPRDRCTHTHKQTSNTQCPTIHSEPNTHTHLSSMVHTHSTTHVTEMSGHATAAAAFVPVSSLQTVVISVAGQWAVRTVTVRTGPQ